MSLALHSPYNRILLFIPFRFLNRRVHLLSYLSTTRVPSFPFTLAWLRKKVIAVIRLSHTPHHIYLISSHPLLFVIGKERRPDASVLLPAYTAVVLHSSVAIALDHFSRCFGFLFSFNCSEDEFYLVYQKHSSLREQRASERVILLPLLLSTSVRAASDNNNYLPTWVP